MTLIVFKDHQEFRPNMTPKQCIQAGIFGGIYFNPKGGRSGILGDSVDIDHKEFPPDWFNGLKKTSYAGRRYAKNNNKYGVVSGTNQSFWESKGWIHPQDPRGWFQWYMRFFMGRRTDDDARQIKRWQQVTGENGRWKRNLLKKIKYKRNIDDYSISPRIRQTLLHWAYEIEGPDFKDMA
jgi:hypothetical protein